MLENGPDSESSHVMVMRKMTRGQKIQHKHFYFLKLFSIQLIYFLAK